MGINLTENYTVEEVELSFLGREYAELDVDLTFDVENDGIGPYEFWGQKCNDRGRDYAVIASVDSISVECINGRFFVPAKSYAFKELEAVILKNECWCENVEEKGTQAIEDSKYDGMIEDEEYYRECREDNRLELEVDFQD